MSVIAAVGKYGTMFSVGIKDAYSQIPFNQNQGSIPLNNQPVDVARGLKRQQAAASTNFVGCFLLALVFPFSLLLLSALNDLTGPSIGPLAPQKTLIALLGLDLMCLNYWDTFLQSLFGSSIFISSSRPVSSAALPSASGVTFMGGFSSFGVGGPPPSVPSTVASGCPYGRLRCHLLFRLCCPFWGRLCGPPCCHLFDFRSFLFFCCFSSCSFFFFCTSFGFSSLLSACGSFFFGLLWGWRCGGGVPGATAVPAATATQWGRLPVSDHAGVFTEPLNFPEGEESDTRLRAESAGAFRQVLSFISSFFPEALPSESQTP